jgi:hypothetical protein
MLQWIKKPVRGLKKKVEGLLLEDVNLRRIRSSPVYRELVDRDPNLIRELTERFPALVSHADQKSALRAHELRVYSQSGEDGLLLHFFSLIRAPGKSFIEIGIEDGTECNSANLAINFGWRGLLVEGSPSLAEKARDFYHRRHKIEPGRVQIAAQFVTRENVNQLFAVHGLGGEIDLLSIDIDGNDYWVWQAIEGTQPRVVAIEYNASFGPARSISTRYNPVFDRYAFHPSGWYHGASLTALTKLAHQKGYILAGCDSFGADAFFIRRELAAGLIEEMTPAEAFYSCAARVRERSDEDQFDQIRHLDFVEV